MKRKQQNSGQAIMELMVLMLMFIIVFLGILLVMGLSIADIEILLDAKFASEQNAQYADWGGSGRQIEKWRYSEFDMNEKTGGGKKIPFLPKDQAVVIQNNMDEFHNNLNSKEDSRSGKDYTFNDFSVLATLTGESNFGSQTPEQSYLAANLLEGRTINYGDNVATLQKFNYANRQKIYSAMEKLIGIKLKNIDLENAESNRVFFPAMKVIE